MNAALFVCVEDQRGEVGTELRLSAKSEIFFWGQRDEPHAEDT